MPKFFANFGLRISDIGERLQGNPQSDMRNPKLAGSFGCGLAALGVAMPKELDTRKPRGGLRSLLPLLSVLLLWASFPPLAFGPVAWVALVPWLLFLKEAPGRWRAVWVSYLAGVLFFLLGCAWLRHVSWPGLFALAALGGFFPAFFAVGLALARPARPVMRMLAAACLWTALDWSRAFVLTGFPWLYLGHTQHAWLSFVQIAELVGVHGLTLLLVAVNVWAAELVPRPSGRRSRRRRKLRLAAIGGVLALLLLASNLYGIRQLSRYPPPEKGPLVGLVQANIPQDYKKRMVEPLEWVRRHVAISQELLRQGAQLIIWPETMFPHRVEGGAVVDGYPCFESTANRDYSREALEELIRRLGADVLVGAITSCPREKEEEARIFNSALLLEAEGRIAGVYHKRHLVPISERLPFAFLEPLVLALSGLERIYWMTPGQGAQLITWRRVQLGVLICYESAFAELAREAVQQGADYLVNLTNDGWFRDSAELEQALNISRFRCIELRTGMARAANTGISAFIDRAGRITRLEVGGKDREVRGKLMGRMDRREGVRTVYLRWGAWWEGGVAVLGLLLVGWGIISPGLRGIRKSV